MQKFIFIRIVLKLKYADSLDSVTQLSTIQGVSDYFDRIVKNVEKVIMRFVQLYNCFFIKHEMQQTNIVMILFTILYVANESQCNKLNNLEQTAKSMMVGRKTSIRTKNADLYYCLKTLEVS